MFALTDIVAGYASSEVLHQVTVYVPTASVVALLGSNGAGKTTLLRVASGSLSPSAGSVHLDGSDLTGSAPHRRVAAGVCHVPEGRGVFPSLTVEENLRVQARPGAEGEAFERATSAFPRLGARRQQVAGTLSGGEQQMLALARAYVQSPKVVLLDEVSMGLAPKIVDEIFEFLVRLAGEGASLLLVEQYVTRALKVADFVYLLNRGRISFAGEPAEVDGADFFSHYVGADAGGAHL